MRRPFSLLAVAATVVVAALLVPLRAEAVTSGPLDTPADLDAALKYEERIEDHFHYGQIYEQLYKTAARTTGDIHTVVGENDSALYTGNYLAAEAFRYALARTKIARKIDVGFWQQQKKEAKNRVEAMVKQYHLLINISENWKTEFNPQIHQDKPITNEGIDFGGGVFPPMKGLLFRACTPTPVDRGMEFVNLGRNPNNNRLVGPLHWPEDGKKYYCIGATSRDAYAGTTFGLMTALDFVSIDDPAMRRMIRDDLIAMTNYAFTYLWSTPRMHGRVVLPEIEGGNDLDNFWSPLFMYTPVQQLNIAQIARHAANAAGTPEQRDKWNTVWLAEIATAGPGLLLETELNAAEPHTAYYKFHLDYLALFNMIRTETDATTREHLMRRALGIMDATTGDDGNALYDALVYALTREPARLEAAVDNHREWLKYRARLDANGNDTKNSHKCGVPGGIECVPKNSTEVLLGPLGTILTIPEYPEPSGQVRARFPLPIADRRGQDFLWQKDPTLLDEDQVPEWEATAADFLLPYWMIRYYTEAAPTQKVNPLPAWPGPTFR